MTGMGHAEAGGGDTLATATLGKVSNPDRTCNVEHIDELLEKCIKLKASDLHISAGDFPWYRVNGKLAPHDEHGILSAHDAQELLRAILSNDQFNDLDVERSVDLSYKMRDGSLFRVNIAHSMGSLSAAFRRLEPHTPTLDGLFKGRKELPILKEIARLERGLVLVTGPTGSGKSTTLAAMIDQINANMPGKHIITIENPIEYRHNSKGCMIHQREVAKRGDVRSFRDALEDALRQDPDVILVGEMRDRESVELALTAAQTGHLVFATLHTIGAAETIMRLLDEVGPADKTALCAKLKASLQAVISQVLIPFAPGVKIQNDRLGRIAGFEIMRVNHAIRNNIDVEKVKSISGYIEASGKELGNQTLNTSLADLAAKGFIAVEDGERLATHKGEFESRYKSLVAQPNR